MKGIKRKLLFLLIVSGLSNTALNGQKQIELGIQISSTYGLAYVIKSIEGETKPRIGYGFGVQSLFELGRKSKIGIEINFSNTQSKIENYKKDFGYYSFDFTATIRDTKGQLTLNSSFVQIPFFMRFNLLGKGKIFVDAGIDYKGHIINNNRTEFVKTRYFPPHKSPLTEQDRYDEPIVAVIDNVKDPERGHELGALIGIGGKWKLTEKLKGEIGLRYNESFSNVFDNLGNPKYGYLEFRVGVKLK